MCVGSTLQSETALNFMSARSGHFSLPLVQTTHISQLRYMSASWSVNRRFWRWGRRAAPYLVSALVLWAGLHSLLRSRAQEGTVVVSHRGIAGSAPENTLAALRQASHHGVQFIEIDVRRSADGTIVLMHDQTVDRTTNGHGRTGELTWDEISQLDAGDHFSPAFVGEPVPSLDEALRFLDPTSVTLVLEVKQPGRYPGIAGQVARKLREFDFERHTIVVSFDHDWLDGFRDVAPETPVGYLQVHTCLPRQMAEGSVVDVHWANVLVDPTLVGRAHRRGHPVWVWTVNDPWLMRLFAWLGVDGITTDHPERWPDAT